MFLWLKAPTRGEAEGRVPSPLAEKRGEGDKECKIMSRKNGQLRKFDKKVGI
jgi:hypothetical protein